MTQAERWRLFVTEAIRGAHLYEPPHGTLRKAIALGARLEVHRSPSLLETITLLFDSATETAPAAVRSVAADQRRLLYRIVAPGAAEPLELDLELRHRSSGRIDLAGQLLPPPVDMQVNLTAGAGSRSVALGPTGEFRFGNLPRRETTLVLEFQSATGNFKISDVPGVIEEDARN